MKVAAMAPQAYRHARRVQTPTFDSPTLRRMETFPSTARKPRQALRYLAITPLAGYAPVTLLAHRRVRGRDLGEQEARRRAARRETEREYIVFNPR